LRPAGVPFRHGPREPLAGRPGNRGQRGHAVCLSGAGRVSAPTRRPLGNVVYFKCQSLLAVTGIRLSPRCRTAPRMASTA